MLPFISWDEYITNSYVNYVTRIINTSKKTKWKKNRRKNK